MQLIFETACAIIVILTLGAMARYRPYRSLLFDYLLLAIGGWIGEQSCVALYHFYEYAPLWHGRIGYVPVLVPLIWPLVILSARDVVESLWPKLAAQQQSLAAACAVAAVVALDASLVEVVAVRAGLWRWAEGGHLGVPLIGILGWSYFAFGADLCLSLFQDMRRLLLLALAPLCAHALILLSWWGLFRFRLRGEPGDASLWGVAAIGFFALTCVVFARRRGHGISMTVAAPRALAALIFLALLIKNARTDGRLWLHTLTVAIPYCAATRWDELYRRPR